MIPLQKKLMNILATGMACIIIVFFYSVPAWGGQSIFSGELPLINGSTVIKEHFEQGVGRLELEINMAPNEVADFYRKVMEEKGWPPGIVMTIGNQSILMLNKQADQFVLKAKSKNGKTKVTIMLIQKTQTQPPAKIAVTTPINAKIHTLREFSGDLIITESNSIIKANIYIKDPSIHRVEMSKEGGGMIFIRPPEARGKIWMLDPVKRQYTILSAGFPTRKDPVQAWTGLHNDMGGGPRDEEILNGLPCTIYHYKYKDQDKIASKEWLADDLRYVIKIETDAELVIGVDSDSKLIKNPIKGTFEILNIKIEKLDDNLFTIPADYVEMK